MKKRFLVITLVLVFLISLVLLAACSKKTDSPAVREPDGTIVYLGDSIAEGLIGPSPLSERDNYAYYALLGKTNNFRYFNHSVSGHKTSGDMLGNDEGGLLGLLTRIKNNGETATLMETHIKQADVIHVSIGGNNLLQYDLGLLMLEVADEEFEDNYAKGTTLINLLHDGGQATRPALDSDRTVDFKFPSTYQNICDIISIIREWNPTATLCFQKVYNPVLGGCKFLYPELLDRLAQIDDDGRFGAQGTKIQTLEQVRAVAQELLNHLNGMFDEYLVANPGSIVIIDANKAFDGYVKTDVRDGKVYIGEGCKGTDLFFSDWTHPSDIGHAVLAETTQAKLKELGIFKSDAVAEYKQIKIEQINRMYSSVAGFDTKAAVDSINAASTYREVTNAYFGAIKGKTPVYGEALHTDNNKHFDSDVSFKISDDNTEIVGFPFGIFSVLFDENESYFTFTADGRVHGQLKTKDNLVEIATNLFELFGVDMDEMAGGISDVDIDEAIVKPYVVDMFPGFTLDHIKESFDLMKQSLGLSLLGIDFDNEVIREIEQTHRLPSDILDRLPADFSFGIAFDQAYHLETVVDADGNEKQAIYVGDIVAHNANTEPFIVFTITEKKGKKVLTLDVEFIMIHLVLEEK